MGVYCSYGHNYHPDYHHRLHIKIYLKNLGAKELYLLIDISNNIYMAGGQGE